MSLHVNLVFYIWSNQAWSHATDLLIASAVLFHFQSKSVKIQNPNMCLCQSACNFLSWTFYTLEQCFSSSFPARTSYALICFLYNACTLQQILWQSLERILVTHGLCWVLTILAYDDANARFSPTTPRWCQMESLVGANIWPAVVEQMQTDAFVQRSSLAFRGNL